MLIRPARYEDSCELAHIHYLCRDRLAQSFMIELGTRFLTTYYRTILREKATVILCAVAQDNTILGFVSGTTDAAVEALRLRRAKFRLFVAALPKLLSKPHLSLKMFRRMGTPSQGTKSFFIHPSGARAAFWCWRPNLSSGPDAIVLFKKWIAVMKDTGAKLVYGEVDAENVKLLKIHEVLGASKVKSYFTPEGRERVLIVYKIFNS